MYTYSNNNIPDNLLTQTMKRIVPATLLCSLLLTYNSAKADLVINEIMQSNVNLIMDDLNDYPDSWVELYNPGYYPENLSNYSISDKAKAENAFSLPELRISPEQYVVIYCDKVGKNLHADFRIESGKDGSVYLFKNGEVTDKVTGMKKMPAPDISYGRLTDGAEEWGYQLEATPGNANCGELSSDLLPVPLFSREGSVSTEAFELELSLPSKAPENAVIRFTTDGSEPNAESKAYTEPIAIDKSTVVRAKLFAPGYISPLSVTQSYIFHERPMTLPIVSIVGEPDDFYSDEKGILSDFVGESGYPNYKYDWRRPINFEYFDINSSSASLNQVCETRLKGQTSRDAKIKSMVVYANKRFGTKRLEHEFFKEQKKGLKDFKSIELRNSGNDVYGIYLRDALSQRLMGGNADLDYQAWTPVVVYLNGNYHGILNLRERANEDYIYTNYDGLENVDVIENWSEVNEGSIDDFNKFVKFYSEDNHTYEEFSSWMDINEFTNYFILNMFVANYDFPSNNMIMWRQTGKNNKWRWITKDLDDGLGIYEQPFDFNYLEWLYDNNLYDKYKWGNRPFGTLLFRQIMKTDKFKNDFIDKSAIYMGDFLTAENTIGLLDYMHSVMEPEWDDHVALNMPSNYSYEGNYNIVKNFINNRYAIIYEQIAEFFKLNAPVPLEVSSSFPEFNIKLQEIPITKTHFNGKFFANRKLTVSTDTEFNNKFQWVVEIFNESGIATKLYFNKEEFNFTMPEASLVNIYIQEVTIDSDLIKINVENLTLNINETYQLFLETDIPDLNESNVQWKSSNPLVASVDEFGLVTANSSGKAIITANYESMAAQCLIEVPEEAGIGSLWADSDAKISVYSIAGILIKKDMRIVELKSLPKGIYIIDSGTKRYKVVI